MAGPGRCDVDTLTFRGRRATRTVALPGANFVPFRRGKPVVFEGKSVWCFVLRTPGDMKRAVSIISNIAVAPSAPVNAYTKSMAGWDKEKVVRNTPLFAR